MTAIAELVALLVSTGIPPESLKSAIDLAQAHAIEQVEIHRNSTVNRVETAAEKRKAWDRERQRKNAEKKKVASYIDSSKEDSIKEDSKKVSKTREKKKLGPLPDGWRPPEHAYPLAAECGVTVPHVEGIFRDYLKSSGKLYADHDAAFCNFVRNQRKFDKGKPQGGFKWNGGIEGVV
jgi:hypothetical protein